MQTTTSLRRTLVPLGLGLLIALGLALLLAIGWLGARDPEARARAHAGVAEFVDDPFLPDDVSRMLGWLRP